MPVRVRQTWILTRDSFDKGKHMNCLCKFFKVPAKIYVPEFSIKIINLIKFDLLTQRQLTINNYFYSQTKYKTFVLSRAFF